jgi:CubicO group peptidase (beta-lactamase class C family)
MFVNKSDEKISQPVLSFQKAFRRRVFTIIQILGIIGFAILQAPAKVNASSSAQGATAPDYSAIDAYVQSELQAVHMPGAALGIVHGDQVVHMKAFGKADSSGRPVTPTTPFILGSVSKSFTALAVMQLVEGNKVNLDAPVQRYLTWFRVADPTASAAITVRQLLYHTSGLPGQAGFLAIMSSDESDGALEQHVRDLSTVQLDRPVGSKYEYCNANYDILGLLVQVISGQPYETYIQDHIFTPLDMSQSFTSRAGAVSSGLAEGYQHMFGLPVARAYPYPRSMVPSGFLISSVEDMSHFMIAQLNGGRYGDQSVLTSQGITTMQTGTASVSADEKYGMGWADTTVKGVRLIAHDGDTYNFHSSIYMVPAAKWGVVLLMNGSNALDFTRMSQISLSVTGMLMGAQISPISLINEILLLSEFYRNSFVFVILLVIVAAWSWFRLRRWQTHPEARPQTVVKKIVFLVLPTLFFLWEAWLFLFSLPQAMGGLRLDILFYFRPDLTGMAILAGLLALGWGIFYAVKAARALAFGRRQVKDSNPSTMV